MGLQAQDRGRELAVQRHVAMRCGFVETQKQKRHDAQQRLELERGQAEGR